MWEHIVVGLVVLIATYVVVRRLLRTLTGPTACDEDTCQACQYHQTCHNHDSADNN